MVPVGKSVILKGSTGILKESTGSKRWENEEHHYHHHENSTRGNHSTHDNGDITPEFEIRESSSSIGGGDTWDTGIAGTIQYSDILDLERPTQVINGGEVPAAAIRLAKKIVISFRTIYIGTWGKKYNFFDEL